MSYTPPPQNQGPAPFGNQNAPYIPPPPPPSRKSPWLSVGLGCGLLILLSFGGCVILGMNMGKQIAADMQKPLDKQAVLAGMGDIPKYPGAQLSEMMTKAQRSVFNNPLMSAAMKGNKPEVAAFETKDDTTKVAAWYDKAMDKAGYEPSTSTTLPNMGNGATEQKQYRKGADGAVIQVQRNTKSTSEYPTLIVIVRMPNMKE